jgi:ectoine hydroxylase-related dioxygenase (phytanoyl-CoA dioxygenase family)
MDDPGYWIEEEVFSSDECDAILASIAEAFPAENRAGIRNLMRLERVKTVANDPRLLELCRRIVGTDLIPYKATLFAKTGKANWLVAFHQDTALPVVSVNGTSDWGPLSEKDGVRFAHAPTAALAQILAVRVNLDESTFDNGPLKVIPGSHHKRYFDEDEFFRIISSKRAEVCTTGKGGVITMSPLLLHASSKSNSNKPRRVLHIEYAPSLDIAPGVRLAIA